MSRRAPAVVAYLLGCFAALAGWVIWADFARTTGSKGGWGWGVALAAPMALWPTLAFALTLTFAARHGLGVSRPAAIAFSTLAGAMTPGSMLIARYIGQALGVRIHLFDGLMGGLLVMALLGIGFAGWLAALRTPPQQPS